MLTDLAVRKATRREKRSKISDCGELHPCRNKIDVLPEGEVAVVQMHNADPETRIDWGGLSRIGLQRAAHRLHA